ncbi:MAG: hypothetical protein CM15mP127_03430 [Gammaproteobacteria bacterium]|nr:MAG: hypothetical protein CM15mP127_03430 [Gammaproteobacteria bacterium]
MLEQTRNGVTVRVEGATHQPVSKIDDNFQQLFPIKNQKIILYCARGGRAGQAKEILSNSVTPI